MGYSHDRILRLKRTFIEDLARNRVQPDGEEPTDVLLALADTRSGLGRWIRGDEADTKDEAPIASFVFVGEDALLFLRGVPSYPGLVVLVVSEEDKGRYFRFISGASGSYFCG